MPLLRAITRYCLIPGLLLYPLAILAEVYRPPGNVIDPAMVDRAKTADSKLLFIYLEPHEACFDLTKPLTTTIAAVNRSPTTAKVDWQAIVESLSLEPIGPGVSKPITSDKRLEPIEVPPGEMAALRVDLKERFAIQGASVYRLSYVRPLDDGRIHF